MRTHKRPALLAATETELQNTQARIQAGRLKGGNAIGLPVGKVVRKNIGLIKRQNVARCYSHDHT